MMNVSDCIINLGDMESTYIQMKNAIEVALKAALANATEVIGQVMSQTKDQLHVKTEQIEIVVSKDKAMFLTKDIKLAATLEDFEDMDYDLSHFSLHKQTEMLNAILNIGHLLEDGKLTVDTDFKSDGLALSSLVLNSLNTNDKQANVLFNGCKVSMKPNEVLVNGKMIYQNGVLYYDKYYCGVLMDLLGKTTTNHKYDVLNEPFSNENIKEWPCMRNHE